MQQRQKGSLYQNLYYYSYHIFHSHWQKGFPSWDSRICKHLTTMNLHAYRSCRFIMQLKLISVVELIQLTVDFPPVDVTNSYCKSRSHGMLISRKLISCAHTLSLTPSISIAPKFIELKWWSLSKLHSHIELSTPRCCIWLRVYIHLRYNQDCTFSRGAKC